MSAYAILGGACLLVAALFIVCHYADPHRRRTPRRGSVLIPPSTPLGDRPRPVPPQPDGDRDARR